MQGERGASLKESLLMNVSSDRGMTGLGADSESKQMQDHECFGRSACTVPVDQLQEELLRLGEYGQLELSCLHVLII